MADHPHLEAEWLHAIAHILIATKRCLGLFAQLTQLNRLRPMSDFRK